MSLLKRGQRFDLAGHRWRVAYVNESRAHCVAVDKAKVKIGDRTFEAKRRMSIDISPASAVDVLPKGAK